MKYVDILKAFETEIGLINDPVNKPLTEDSLYWLNQAVAKFVKLRFNGDQAHKMGFEQTEKRREDLRRLMCNTIMEETDFEKKDQYDIYSFNYPQDLLYILNENATITDLQNKHEYSTSIFECTRDSFMYRVTNSLTDFHYNHYKARPIRIVDSYGCYLLTDKQYKIKEYTLGYLRKPNELNLDNPLSEYSDFEDNVMYEIIKMAAQMYLENAKNERYQTITQEVLTQE